MSLKQGSAFVSKEKEDHKFSLVTFFGMMCQIVFLFDQQKCGRDLIWLRRYGHQLVNHQNKNKKQRHTKTLAEEAESPR